MSVLKLLLKFIKILLVDLQFPYIKARISQFMKKVWMSFQKCITVKLR